MSGHPLDKYIKKFDNFNFNSTYFAKNESEESVDEDDEFANVNSDIGIADGTKVSFGGIITEIKKLYTKRDNKEMAFVKVEDIYGTIEIMLFPKVYEKLKPKLIVDKMGTFTGKVSLREGENPSILLDDIAFWDEEERNDTKSQQEQVKVKTLYLKFDRIRSSPFIPCVLTI